MKKNFKIDDRVKVVKKGETPMYSEAVVGDVGVIIAERGGIGNPKQWLVRFDVSRPYYHTGGGRGEDRRHYWCTEEMLQRIEQAEKIIITTDGVTTTARHYKGKELLGSAEAKCSPADTFNFKYGARLAFDRLLVKDKPILDMKKLAEKIRKNTPKINAELHKAFERLRDRLKTAAEPKPEPKPEPKFEVGDVVRVNAGARPFHALIPGSFAVVRNVNRSIFGGENTYCCAGISSRGTLEQCVAESDLEKYEKGE